MGRSKEKVKYVVHAWKSYGQRYIGVFYDDDKKHISATNIEFSRQIAVYLFNDTKKIVEKCRLEPKNNYRRMIEVLYG